MCLHPETLPHANNKYFISGAAVWAGFEIQGAYTTILKNAGM